mmetsp:Transcript_8679/g.8797  ORF Transcript_8679/g.8797 Transcript_8679/m.8797 type:complete len:236 (+) Transcript_8679:106-813(+)
MSSVIPQQPLTDVQTGWGDHPSILEIDTGKIQILQRAKFATLNNCCFACDSYDMSKNRRYFYVLENGLESNEPVACRIGPIVLPPNCCCPGVDCIYKTYFDRGPFDRQSPYFKFGVLKGPPSIYAGPVKQVCCCMDCCECWNYYASGYFACLCGERISILPFEYYCCCCPTRSWWMCNCFSLCGVKTGEPMVAFTRVIASHLLDIHEAQRLSEEINNSRSQWKERTGYKGDESSI